MWVVDAHFKKKVVEPNYFSCCVGESTIFSFNGRARDRLFFAFLGDTRVAKEDTILL